MTFCIGNSVDQLTQLQEALNALQPDLIQKRNEYEVIMTIDTTSLDIIITV